MYQTLKRFAMGLLPKALLRFLEPGIRKAMALYYKGNKHFCPVCEGSFRKLIGISNDVGFSDALCPSCSSIKRVRLMWLFLHRELNLPEQLWQVLDFSPHRALALRMRLIQSLNYLSTDYETTNEDRQYDITLLPEPDERFHLVVCYHVLEHIPEDRQAMTELYRILKPGGIALLQVPHQQGSTYQDDTITTPEGRLAAFGQEDHVRIYGREDFSSQLRSVGFAVTERVYAQELGEAAIEEYQLNPKEVIFVAQKPED